MYLPLNPSIINQTFTTFFLLSLLLFEYKWKFITFKYIYLVCLLIILAATKHLNLINRLMQQYYRAWRHLLDIIEYIACTKVSLSNKPESTRRRIIKGKVTPKGWCTLNNTFNFFWNVFLVLMIVLLSSQYLHRSTSTSTDIIVTSLLHIVIYSVCKVAYRENTLWMLNVISIHSSVIHSHS